MEFEKLFNDSIEYTRETFVGHWVRWLIFILLGLPIALVRFVFDPKKIITGSTIPLGDDSLGLYLSPRDCRDRCIVLHIRIHSQDLSRDETGS